MRVWINVPVVGFHIFIVWSQEPETKLPFWRTVNAITLFVWPVRVWIKVFDSVILVEVVLLVDAVIVVDGAVGVVTLLVVEVVLMVDL